jgi:hypothetical protein
MKFRKLEAPDRIPVYKLFRESLWDYMLQHGLADSSDVNDIDEFFMNHQPPCLFRRDGQVVAYAFGSDGYAAGPAAALNPEDLPALLQWIEQSACQMQQNSLWLTIPAAARSY